MNYSTQFLQDCDHEEADTRIALHLYDAINRGARNVLVRTVDTDVIVILIGLFFFTSTHRLLLQYGLLLAPEKISDITILTASSKHWEQINHKHCHFFIHFQVVTPHRNSMERGKNRYGMHGSLIPV